ncbi:bifunctional folylpolyglutamate synthase/dihydrofolate synthase [Citricoccus sp. NR2]|uniref:bifunctional folylpolyglutamate synthase/dihydrofolate synthase n=1 Tax=Citricoccus sp. NR2 TaxID=3004095 RepID=UPI0022DE035B|nr:folylpolyglutamate synthase/dihydrofolate synthase family protein [Citricoccus sp. NR2]WBL18414.1 bifunctional folylpolyglutamate synthase/dihydrofolate synthase [Citricoccus sp. NR2]
MSAEDPTTTGERSTAAEVYADLLDRAPENRMEPRMEPMRRIMELLGEPQRSAPVIHLTGTNGKTSTARMIEALLRAHGLRTGRYTSPHLVSVTERICLDGEPVEEETFVRVWNEILPLVTLVDAELIEAGENRLTYFEAVTALGFAIFADAPVDVMILEVGLGGVTDATNVADAQVSVITPISLDHTELLGDTEGEIAEEKSGIIKPGGFLVSSRQDPDAAQVLLDRAREVGAAFRFQDIEFGVSERNVAVGGQQVTLAGLAGTYENLMLPMHGAHQAENLSVAVAAVEAFIGGGETELGEDVLTQALTLMSSPGRLEVLKTKPPLVIDAAHNPAGIRVAAAAVQEAFGFSRTVLVVGILAEKDSLGILTALQEEFDGALLCLTASDSPRAVSAEELGETALDAGWDEDDIHVSDDVVGALRWAVDQAQNITAAQPEGVGGGILVTGSITLIGQLRDLLGPGPDQADAGVVVDPLDVSAELAVLEAMEPPATDEDSDEDSEGEA